MKVAVVLLAAVATVHSSAIRSGRQGWSTPGWSSTPPPTTAGWSSTAPPTTAGWSSTAPPTTAGWSSTAPPTTAGWSSTAPPTTAGWSSTAPPTTAGWSSTAPPTTAGWSSTAPPTTAGWSSTTPGWSGGKVGGWSSTTAGWSAPPSLTSIDLNAALAAAGSGWAAENHAENVAVTGAGGWGPNAELVISAGGESAVEQEGDILQVTNQDSQEASSLNIVSVSQEAEASEGESLDALGVEISNAQSGWAGAAGEGSSAADATSSLIVSKKH